MKYYEMHEQAYQKLKEEGAVSWDGYKDINAILDQDINRTIAEELTQFFLKERKGS